MACAKICKHFPEIIFRLKKKNHGLTLAGRYWLAEPDAMAIRSAEAELP